MGRFPLSVGALVRVAFGALAILWASPLAAQFFSPGELTTSHQSLEGDAVTAVGPAAGPARSSLAPPRASASRPFARFRNSSSYFTRSRSPTFAPFAVSGLLVPAEQRPPFQLTGGGDVTFTLEWQAYLGG